MFFCLLYRDVQFLDPAGLVVDAWDAEVPVLDVDVRLAADDRTAEVAVARAQSSVLLLSVGHDLTARFDRRIESLAYPEFTPEPESHAVRFSMRGDRLFVGDISGRVTAWDLSHDRLVFALPTQSNGQTIASASRRLPRTARRAVTGIEVGIRDHDMWPVGRDGTVKHFDVQLRDFITRFQLAAGARFVFDRDRPELLWATEGTFLSLVDSRCDTPDDQRLRDRWQVDAEGVDFSGITRAAATSLIATIAGRRIDFWRRQEDQIVSVPAGIEHDVPLRCISLRHDGAVVAGYDEQNLVTLWDVATSQRLGQVSVADDSGEGRRYASIVAFNADGTRLVVAGLRQDVRIFDAKTLELLEVPYVVGGTVATGVAWDPVVPARVCVVSDKGGMKLNQELSESRGYQTEYGEATSIAFNTDGSRCVRSFRSGLVVLSDRYGEAEVHRFGSPHAQTNAVVLTEAAFDPTGKRLALMHADGMVAIWETEASQVATAPRIEASTGAWHGETLENPRRLENAFSAPAFELGRNGALFALYVERTPGDVLDSKHHYAVNLFRADVKDSEIQLADLGHLEDRRAGEVVGSLASA